jgi:hypothetical protein
MEQRQESPATLVPSVNGEEVTQASLLEAGTGDTASAAGESWDWQPWLLKRIPALEALRTYSWESAWRDMVAGLSVGCSGCCLRAMAMR